MTAAAIVSALASPGSDSYKRILLNHSINEPVFGVKIEELKNPKTRQEGLHIGSEAPPKKA